jgi:hypothetical protein
MKRFLDKKIVTAQDASYLTPYLNPQSFEGKLDKTLDDQTDEQRAQSVDKAADQLRQNVSNENQAKAIFIQNGMSESDYNDEKDDSFSLFSIPPLQFNQFMIGLWPIVRDKNISFKKFLYLYGEVANRYKGNVADVESFFKSFISVLPNLEKTLGTSDEVINKAVQFLLTPGKSAKEFQDYLLYQSLLRYGLFNEVPENKKSDILKATEQLEKVRTDINSVEQETLDFLTAKAEFLKVMSGIYQDVTLALMQMQKSNYANIIGVFRNGLKLEDMKYYLENFKKGMMFGELQRDLPISLNPNPDVAGGTPVGEGGRRSTNYISDKVKRKIFASGVTPPDYRDDVTSVSGVTPEARPSGSTPSNAEPTDSSEFSNIYGKFVVDINEFERTTINLAMRADEEIKYIVNKQSSSPQIGPFSAGNVFQYLQDEDESLEETDRILNLLDKIIGSAINLKNSLIEKIRSTNVSGSDQIRQKNTALIAIEEKFDLFKKDMRSKQLGLKFNKVLISRQNEYSEAQDLYEDIKVEMESNVSVRPVLAPKAILAGFKMADILEEIAEEFKNIGSNNPIRAEQAMKTARRWENFAKQQRAHVFTEIYPGMAQSIGIEATKPTISPSFSLRGAFVDLVDNVRFAGKFMDKEVESDKRFRDYWNNLFMQSKDPRPMGDIIEEKPKHGNLTTEEDAKLHKKTMRKFKKPAAKSRFKKN